MATLDLRVGIKSDRGRRPDNQDFAAAYLGDTAWRSRQGCIAALADGVGGAAGGRVAAELSVKGVIDGFMDAKPTLGVQQAIAPIIESLNDWIWAQGRQDDALKNMATTLSVLILRDRGAYILHVGDSRVYRLRDGALTVLSQDHVADDAERRHVLLRGIGFERGVRIDYAMVPLRVRDRFLLCSDGVHAPLLEGDIAALLDDGAPPEFTAHALVTAALAAGGQDNITALVLDVVAMPRAQIDDLEMLVADLPVLPLPRTGDIVDGFRLTQRLADGRYAQVFRALDETEKSSVALKFPKPTLNNNPAFRAAFLRELWVGTQIHSPLVGELLTLPPERQTRLYIPAPFYDGETLEARLSRRPGVGIGEGVIIGQSVAKGLGALHTLGIIHRDVKPENIMLTKDGSLRLMDLGIARLPGRTENADDEIAGTPSYMAPEQLLGPRETRERGNDATDIYALGVTLYRTLSGQYPYGEIEPFETPLFRAPVPLSAHRPDVPLWLELLVERAIAIDPRDRPSTALAFALELEDGLTRQVRNTRRAARRVPLMESHPVRCWQFVSFVLAVILIWRSWRG